MPFPWLVELTCCVVSLSKFKLAVKTFCNVRVTFAVTRSTTLEKLSFARAIKLVLYLREAAAFSTIVDKLRDKIVVEYSSDVVALALIDSFRLCFDGPGRNVKLISVIIK